MDGIFRNEKDDISQNYLVSRQVAHEYNSPPVQGFINRYSRMMQEPPTGQMAEQKFKATQEGQPKEEVQAETEGLQEPFLDPTAAAAGGFAGAGVMSLNQGMKLMPSLGRAVLSGVVGGVADYPIGAASEIVEEKSPALALPFNVITGLVSGATIESAIEKGVVRALGKAADSDTIRRVVQDMRMRLADETGEITVFHGSPHKFDKFSLEKVGTGEGAQAFGWGLYFTDKPGIAKYYANTGQYKLVKNDKEINVAPGSIEDVAGAWLEDAVNSQSDNPFALASKRVRELFQHPTIKKEDIIDTLAQFQEEGIAVKKSENIYKATLHKGKTPDQYSYLEWDKTVPDSMRKRIVSAMEKEGYKVDDLITGQMWSVGGKSLKFANGRLLYKDIANIIGSDKEASLFLLRAGIDGIKYPAGTLSGGTKDNAFNYVVFDENVVQDVQTKEGGVWKSVIQSLNDIINNEVGAIGDPNEIAKIRKRLEGATDVKAELGKIQAEKAQDTSRKILVSIGRQPETSAKAEATMLNVANSEDLQLTDKAININLNRIESEDDIKKILTRVSEIYQTEIQTARRGVRPNEMTERTANLLGMTPEQLLTRRRGQAFNAEEALAARRILVSSAENLHGLAQKVKTLDATDADKFEFRKALNLHYAIQAQVSGMTAEAGRALQQFNIKAGSSEGRTRNIKEFLQGLPGDVTIEQMADAISTFDSAEDFSKIPDMIRATTKEMFLEAWINGLLSGPQTHMINSLSNALNAVWQVPERFLAGMIGRVLPGDQAIKETEALQQAYGLVEGFKDGVKAFGKVIRTGATEDDLTKLEAARYKAITAENVRQLPLIKKLAPNALQEGGIAARAVDFMGETVRTPGRFLMAEDELFKSIGYRMELRAQAYRMASQEGLNGDALAQRMADILQNPEALAPNVHLASVDAARYQTFTSPLESKILGALSQSKNPVVKLIVPFVRTPTNILKYAFERTPFAVASQKIRADISAGGARRDLALARISLGSMLMSTAAIMAAEGKITGGGPSDPKLAGNLRRQGWQPYSIKIGDKYIQYGRLEPLGMVFGLAADFSEITGLAGDEMSPESENLASAIVMAVSRNVTSKTWLRGISEAVQAMDDPDRYGNKYIQNYARSLVPSIVAQAERSIDPESEAVYNLVDSMKSRIPGYSDDLPPRRDLWGDPITTQIGTGKRSWAEIAYSTLSPIYVSEGKSSPIDKELTRMKIGLSKPGKKQSIMGVPMELPPKLYDEFIKYSTKNVINGKDIKEFLNDFVKSPDYKQMSDERKEEEIRNIMTKARNVARMKMLEDYPQLREVAIAWKQRLAQ